MSDEMISGYGCRMAKVCEYIQTHLDDDLSVNHLSQVAHFSRYHFHRQFANFVGVNVTRYILLARLKRAAYQLIFEPKRRVIDIAFDAGFENPESFSRAFKQICYQTPSQFKQKPDWAIWNELFKLTRIERNIEMNVDVVVFPETKVAVLEHKGSPDLINESVAKFIEWRKQSGLSPVGTSDSFGIVYNNPNTVAPEEFCFDLCGSVSEEVPENVWGVSNKTISGGRCVKIRHLGSRDDIEKPICHLYGQWLPESGEELRDAPLFFHYINLFPEVDEHALITDIYLPIK